MPLMQRISREAASMKPHHGDRCNRCGTCCEAAPCPLAQSVLGVDERSGRCPALHGKPGETSCGLVTHPKLFAPVKTAIHGHHAMSDAASLLVGAGNGCDCRINGELRNIFFHKWLLGLDIILADKINSARKLWGI